MFFNIAITSLYYMRTSLNMTTNNGSRLRSEFKGQGCNASGYTQCVTVYSVCECISRIGGGMANPGDHRGAWSTRIVIRLLTNQNPSLRVVALLASAKRGAMMDFC